MKKTDIFEVNQNLLEVDLNQGYSVQFFLVECLEVKKKKTFSC